MQVLNHEHFLCFFSVRGVGGGLIPDSFVQLRFVFALPLLQWVWGKKYAVEGDFLWKRVFSFLCRFSQLDARRDNCTVKE